MVLAFQNMIPIFHIRLTARAFVPNLVVAMDDPSGGKNLMNVFCEMCFSFDLTPQTCAVNFQVNRSRSSMIHPSVPILEVLVQIGRAHV